jgi:hypothetical protein
MCFCLASFNNITLAIIIGLLQIGAKFIMPEGILYISHSGYSVLKLCQVLWSGTGRDGFMFKK